MHFSLVNKGVDVNDAEAVEKALDKGLETGKTSPRYEHYKNMVANYRKYKPTIESTVHEVQQARAEVYKAAQPKSHRFVLRKA